MKARIAARLALFALFSCLSFRATAQQAARDVDEFGTQDGIDLWIPASQFLGGEAHWGARVGFDYYRIADGGDAFRGWVPLPQGAHVDGWRVFFYDDSPGNDIYIELEKVFDSITGAGEAVEVFGNFTSSGTPGYSSHHVDESITIDLREPLPGSGLTRNQAADFYQFFLAMPLDDAVAFKGVRVIWHRQVSPAPATATFNDVPTSDPAFQYIEALAASGITAGCNTSPPLYCPDATLTRRQMAVFLAKALGLHWPNS